MFFLNSMCWNSTRHFSPKFTGIMQPKLSVSVSLHNLPIIRTSPSPKNVIFKSNFAPKQWLVCMIFSAIILLHLRIHYSKKNSITSIHVSTLISSITSPTNTSRMMSQSILLTPLFLHSIPTIQPIFLKYFYIFLIIYATPRFLPPPPVQNIKKGRRPRTTDDPEEGPKAYSTSLKPPGSANFFSWARSSVVVQTGKTLSHCSLWKPVRTNALIHTPLIEREAFLPLLGILLHIAGHKELVEKFWASPIWAATPPRFQPNPA